MGSSEILCRYEQTTRKCNIGVQSYAFCASVFSASAESQSYISRRQLTANQVAQLIERQQNRSQFEKNFYKASFFQSVLKPFLRWVNDFASDYRQLSLPPFKYQCLNWVFNRRANIEDCQIRPFPRFNRAYFPLKTEGCRSI